MLRKIPRLATMMIVVPFSNKTFSVFAEKEISRSIMSTKKEKQSPMVNIEFMRAPKASNRRTCCFVIALVDRSNQHTAEPGNETRVTVYFAINCERRYAARTGHELI